MTPCRRLLLGLLACVWAWAWGTNELGSTYPREAGRRLLLFLFFLLLLFFFLLFLLLFFFTP